MERKELIELVECIRFNVYSFRGCAYIKGAKPESVEWVLDKVLDELKKDKQETTDLFPGGES